MKYYAFMPFWHWPEVMDERPTDGDYILGNIVRTADSLTALTLYSETPCPASQLIEANSEEELEGKEFEDMKNIFTYLSKVYEFYCNHVVLKCICFNSVFYIGFNDNKICIGNKYHKLEHEDKRDIIPVNYRITQLHRKPAL